MDFPIISQPVLSHAQPVEKNRVITVHILLGQYSFVNIDQNFFFIIHYYSVSKPEILQSFKKNSK